MHTPCCGCPKCQSARDRTFSVEHFGAMPRPRAAAAAELLSEAEEVELAMELLGVSNEAEMEQFLGGLFRTLGRGLKTVGGKLLPVLGGALKGLAKKALPFVGGALGSFIPIPGVGTALGTALGSAVSQALELEFGELESEEAEFELARRFVRLAASAAQQASGAPPNARPEPVVRDALLAAARAHLPNFAANQAERVDEAEVEGRYSARAGSAMSGRWTQRGRDIVVHGI